MIFFMNRYQKQKLFMQFIYNYTHYVRRYRPMKFCTADGNENYGTIFSSDYNEPIDGAAIK